ncbi:phospholipid-transporting ATPase ID isoform X2 [Carcharodon carcharias]|uniref:phospholipid-transporting ATPase ID isoform X2 n=1 Tax=Carcharodon carcharias TaxID=13397 RepID=UPI001B7E213B|nr:phospholipid-transporting ATPase ID isoform X2 [Carcharodon carcharias]XP_041031150.1 phospholipid-transporting ATPase ID isoform X2 [Carcharodon carcharias]XP_041031151.1 phospholipid-transporting ATPase ID isoform X2 [Carcharodon carcharias]XP_041031152.1 phospholipid-transporting ATPase ID isoform X2 [Carcharodon carcharias]XP_041031153.1 phospholipid-transporting ATPase ID isoform X2 [Carcharodon carcharias]XP_041031154.1 phospholipid-transporting ATPase ID isoform X2 [Carcharodon carch
MKLCRDKLIEEERRVIANNREYNDKFQYANNRIKTSKYNVVTFLPINLFEQFQRVANAYFLFLLLLQLIPHISSLSWFTTIVPLVLVLTITAVKDATDDFFRYKSDNQVNNRQSQVLIDGKLQNEKWMNVRVGDVIKLENNQFVAADLLLLSSSEPHGLSYVETAELDGETNLKVRQALPVTSELGADMCRLAEFDGEIICEPPNNKLDKFTGTLFWKDKKYSLDNEKMLLRGCVLRNTEWGFGLVIFAGPDTKLMQNSGRTKFKRTSIDRLMNTLVLWIFGFLVCMGIILGIGNSIWESEVGFHFHIYLPWDDWMKNAIFSGFLSFWSYIIILNTVVPISLYVSVEVIRLGHSYFINWDRKMYYANKNTSAEARTTTLNEELGQIEYIFSDKTGTLTQNIMIFNKCSINGKAYGDVYDELGHKTEISEKTLPVDFSFNTLADPKFQFYDASLVEAIKLGDPSVHEFFRLLSLCHTVMPEEKNEGELVYQAQSPDEGALVTAARNFGFVFRSRTPETITVNEMGKPVVYQLLAILDFNNVRKRMSVIVRNPEGQIRLYSKGADTILFERLHPSNEDLMCITSDHLSEFAGEGLRTLVLAYKDLDEAYFAKWQKMHHHASTALENRDEQLSDLYEEIEQDMMLLGATAVEDKLQEGVSDTIANLILANIKVWVLTGDKQETAMNIGYSCNILTDDMNEIFIVSGYTVLEVREQLRKATEQMMGTPICNGYGVSVKNGSLKLESVIEETVMGDYALVINGHSLAHALEADMQREFLDLASMCKTVICCRVTPLQKAQVVELVKTLKKAVTLAIGDGANDVSMIKSAHIGVGISGQEGMQAVLASDYSFGQFRYLQRLLLVHGRWSYLRMCKFLYYFFYKNFAFTLVHFWFGFFCGFSAQTVYDQWFITLYNIVYTSLPVLAMGIFDQDVNEQKSLEYTRLYEPGQLNLLFNKREFFICIIQGVYTSIVLFFVPYGAFCDTTRDDGTHLSDYQSFAVTVATSLVIVVSVQIGLDTSYWTAVNHFFIWGSVAVYFSILFAMHSNGLFSIFPSQFPFVGNARNSLVHLTVWLVIIVTTVLCIVPVVAIRFLTVHLKPTLSDKVRYMQLARRKQKPVQHHMRRVNRTSSRRSGYAFAHQEGFGELITSGRNMRFSKPAPVVTGKSMPSSTSWIENLRKKTTDTVNSFGSEKNIKL